MINYLPKSMTKETTSILPLLMDHTLTGATSCTGIA